MQQIRTRHNQFVRLSKDGKASAIKSQDIQQQIKGISQQLQTNQNGDMSPQTQELTQYMQQYFELLDLLNDVQNKSIKKQDFDSKISQILKGRTQHQIKTPQSPINQKQSVTHDAPKRSQKNGHDENNMSYFVSKNPRKPEVNSFRSVINDPILPNNQSFKKKKVSFIQTPQKPIVDHQALRQIQLLKQQNKQLKKLLQENKSNQQQKQQYEQRIRKLQNEIAQLQNNTSKVKYIQKVVQLPLYQTQQNEPYVLNPRSNDLQVLTQKSQSRYDKNEKFDDFSHKDEILPESASRNIFKDRIGSKTEYFGQHSEILSIPKNSRNLSQQRSFQKPYSLINLECGSQFDSFSLHTSNYSHFNFPGRERYGIEDSLTCTRNKVAFFKNSLRIAYDDDYEIAFKRSQVNLQENELRFIFYVKNKTSRSETINISYQDQSCYNISIEEKMRTLEPYSQSRQVIILKNNNSYELDSIIDCKIEIGQRIYNLWVPANFIKFDYRFRKLAAQTRVINVIPEKYFETYQQAVKVLPLANKQQGYLQTSAFLYGTSKCHDGAIKLTWTRQKQLRIQTTEKWISYISFILCKNL